MKDILDTQREYFNSGSTLEISFRKQKLKDLYQIIKKYEKDICEALYKDLGKSSNESYMCEIGLVLSEISYMLKHIDRFTKKKTVHTPLSQFPSHSYKIPIPYGNVLIMSPWNYPFLLTISPMVNALASGNTAIIKPSAYSYYTGKIIKKMINECFDKQYVYVVLGGREENKELLKQKFDFIFFTGSTYVGKEVLSHSAKHLIPTVLELGGKSPCIVDQSANIKLSAKRIVWGKFLNCGQTCVAPDYILCHKDIKDELINEIRKEIVLQYSSNPLSNNDYGRIINEKHFLRLLSLINKDKIIIGGKSNISTLKIEPTVLHNITYNDKIMHEEIFGPILPILTYDNFNDIIVKLKQLPKPLALYLFTQNKEQITRINKEVSYGGGCINDVVIHLATSEMGFGGIGESGMGSYHGKDGFDAFSHYKSIVDKKTWLDLPFRYQPFNKDIYKKIIRLFLR